MSEIRQIISAASISESAKKTAIAIFEALGQAEAKIHDTSIESVHFHEVGAVDAMVDIVCAAVGAEALGVDRDYLFALERRRWHGEVRARNVSGAGSGDGGTAEGGACLFLRPAGGAGHADGRGDREDSGFALRGVSGDED